MIYESTISYLTQDNNGNDKVVKETYALNNYDTFEGVETRMYGTFQHLRDLDVIAIKRSNATEVINNRTSENDKVWIAEVIDTFVDDDGNEKETHYRFLLYSLTFETANNAVKEHLKQGYGDLEIVSLKRTRIREIFEYTD